jgi:hypothetical protein
MSFYYLVVTYIKLLVIINNINYEKRPIAFIIKSSKFEQQ